MVYVYVLESLLDSGYYIGICEDLDKRLSKHNRGGVRSTKTRRPFKIVYFEKFAYYKLARIREKEIKSYKGGNKPRQLIT